MTNNLLKLNDDKTQLIIITTSETTSRHEDIVVNIGNHQFHQIWDDRGTLMFDSTCCLNDHVNKLCQNINYQLYSISKIQKHLDKPTTEKNDKFCSDIPFELLQQRSIWHQWIFSVPATTLPELCRSHCALEAKCDHITLPVEKRVNYKIVLLAYMAQHGMAPAYLSSLVSL